MAKVKVAWTIEVTESYEVEMDFEDFQGLFDEGTAPTLEQVKAGDFDTSDMDVHEMAGSEEEENGGFVSVDERYFDSIELVDG